MDNQEKKNINDMSSNELLDLLLAALNKANNKGVYTIDEAYIIKVVYDKLKNNLV